MNEFFLVLMRAAIWVPPLFLAITLHEAAHGFVALRCGDTTAKMMGRLTLNPFKHVDPVGTVLLPGILIVSGAPFVFGYAKPVPVNFHALRNPKIDMVKVAIAGPVTNIFLAFVSAFLLKFIDLFPPAPGLVHIGASLVFSIYINVLLAVFNMLPIPPLDGGRVAVGLLPDFLSDPLARLERVGFLIVIGLLALPPLLHLNFNLFEDVLSYPIEGVVSFIKAVASISIA